MNRLIQTILALSLFVVMGANDCNEPASEPGEPCVTEGAEDWRNTTIPLPPLTHHWQHVSIPLYQFLVSDPGRREIGVDGDQQFQSPEASRKERISAAMGDFFKNHNTGGATQKPLNYSGSHRVSGGNNQSYERKY